MSGITTSVSHSAGFFDTAGTKAHRAAQPIDRPAALRVISRVIERLPDDQRGGVLDTDLGDVIRALFEPGPDYRSV